METLREILGFIADWMVTIIVGGGVLLILWLFVAEVMRSFS